MNIGIIQTTCAKDTETNISATIEKIRSAAQNGAQVVCTQELFSSRYFCEIEDRAHFTLAEAIPGPTTEKLQAIAQELNIVIIASLFERAGAVFFNTAIVIDADGTYLGKYRKTHIPYDPGYYEKFYFSKGDTGYPVFSTHYGTIGVLICWDQWYPEPARALALKGAQVIFYPTAIGWDKHESKDIQQEQFEAWQTIQRSHAIANGVCVVSVNRIGIEGRTTFWGGSFITNQFGTKLFEAPHDQAIVHVQTLDLGRASYYRETWPFLKERRTDMS